MKYIEQEDILIKECLELEITYQQMSEFILEDFNIYRSSASIQQRVSRLQLSSNINKRLTTKEYINKLSGRNIEVLGDYINANTHTKHKCLKCETIWLTTPGHILDGTGCPECGRTKLRTYEEYSELLKDRSILVLETYINSQTKIKHKCIIDNHIWKAIPNNILKGQGCPICYNKVRSKNHPGGYGSLTKEKAENIKYPLYFYKVKLQFKDEIFYKYGLTKNADKSRFKQYYPYKVMEEITFDKYKAWDAICKEKSMVSNYTPTYTFYGYTECYI